jgi:hypothetical protein
VTHTVVIVQAQMTGIDDKLLQSHLQTTGTFEGHVAFSCILPPISFLRNSMTESRNCRTRRYRSSAVGLQRITYSKTHTLKKIFPHQLTMELNEFARQIKEAKGKAQGAADVVRLARDREAHAAEAARSRVKDVARAIANEVVAPCVVHFCKELPLPKPTVTEQDDEILITCTGANVTAAAFRVRPALDLAEKVSVGFCFYRNKAQLSFKGGDYPIEPLDRTTIQQWVEGKLLQTVPDFLKAASEVA